MQDTVIKGNGRSRIIKGPADMPTTYDQWRTQVMAGTAQLDISVNPDTTESGGISQLGTPLNKANLLTDEAATLFGLKDNATIDAMFKALWALKGKANGFAGLDSNGRLISTQSPMKYKQQINIPITINGLYGRFYICVFGNFVSAQFETEGLDEWQGGTYTEPYDTFFPSIKSMYDNVPFVIESKIRRLDDLSIDYGSIIMSTKTNGYLHIVGKNNPEHLMTKVTSSENKYVASFLYPTQNFYGY